MSAPKRGSARTVRITSGSVGLAWFSGFKATAFCSREHWGLGARRHHHDQLPVRNPDRCHCLSNQPRVERLRAEWRRPPRAEAYESRETITRSGGTRRAETATRQARRRISASAFSPQPTATWSRPIRRLVTRTASWCSRVPAATRSGRTSSWAIPPYKCPTASLRVGALISGINRLRAPIAWSEISVSLASTHPARSYHRRLFPGNLRHDAHGGSCEPTASSAVGVSAVIVLAAWLACPAPHAFTQSPVTTAAPVLQDLHGVATSVRCSSAIATRCESSFSSRRRDPTV